MRAARRADFDPAALDELKRSIQEKGIIQPITVRRVQGGYQLITGERRVRAARSAGSNPKPKPTNAITPAAKAKGLLSA